jgi:ribosomal protein S18 acetylase RimI-like enzyme
VDGRLTVRPATAHDDAALLELDSEPGTGFPSVLARERTSFFTSTAPADTIVAVLDGELVGYLCLGHPTPLPENAHVSAVEGFTVAPTWRGRGVGRALLDAAVAEARRRGSAKISLRVLSTNERARQVYAGAGFTVEGVLRGEFVIDGRPVDDVLMAMAL